MAYANTEVQHNGSAILSTLAAPFVWFFNAMVKIGEANAYVRRSEELYALSDEQLEKIGLKREDIAKHVFGHLTGF